MRYRNVVFFFDQNKYITQEAYFSLKSTNLMLTLPKGVVLRFNDTLCQISPPLKKQNPKITEFVLCSVKCLSPLNCGTATFALFTQHNLAFTTIRGKVMPSLTVTCQVVRLDS